MIGVGERDQHLVLDLGEAVDDLGLGPLFAERRGQVGADLLERLGLGRRQLGLGVAREDIVGEARSAG